MIDDSVRSLRPGGLRGLGRALVRRFMDQATVAEVETVSRGFQLITLDCPQFRSVAWSPGDKLQIAIGGGLATRTYTPIDWDLAAGRTRILAYSHASAPGSDWARAVQADNECSVFGPRPSLDVGAIPGPVLLLGDETSFGLALAMQGIARPGDLEIALEVTSFELSSRALDRVGLAGWRPFVKRPDGAHFDDIERLLARSARAQVTFVLTGRSTTIQRARQVLRARGVPASRVMTKAYWAPGKVGLD